MKQVHKDIICPECASNRIEFGAVCYGKQLYKCLQCGRLFVLNPKRRVNIYHEQPASVMDAIRTHHIDLSGVIK